MTHGSLFSGIGGFDLAAEWMGWENKFHCEWNPFGQKVLKHYWPQAESFNDITKTNFEKYAGTIDIISGGFPCQPYSTAGKRLGKADERHLFPEMLRAIKEIRPRWVIGENVRGLVSWNGGMVFHEVCDDLEREGYEVQSFLIPAASVNAPHRRDRIWFVAYSKSIRSTISKLGESQSEQQIQTRSNLDGFENMGDATDSNNERGSSGLGQVQGKDGEISKRNNNPKFSDSVKPYDVSDTKSIGQEYSLENGKLEGGRPRFTNKRDIWDSFPSVTPICNGDDGLSSRLDSITFPKWRNESIKGGGNAIVPQVAYQIFKAIEQFENL